MADDLADTGKSDFDAELPPRNQWSSPGLDLSVDAWVVTDPRSTIVGHANVVPEGDGRLDSWGLVHPDHRRLGLGSALLDRIEARAAERIEPGSGSVFTAVTDLDVAGPRWWLPGVRTRAVVPTPPARPGRTVAPTRRVPAGHRDQCIEPERDLAPRVHAIFVEAFREEWGYRVIPFDEWSSLEVETTSYDPSLWLLATDGDEAVGALLRASCGATGAGSASSACGSPGAGAGWRRRCSGHVRDVRARELPRVMLTSTPRTRRTCPLYERLGMRTVRGWDVYEKRVG